MLPAWITSSADEAAGSAASKCALPSNSLNWPRTVVTIAWRAEKPTRLCAASIV